MLPTEPIRPLHDVWLRPRRVFRELASRPIGAADYLLAAAQGIAGWLALSRERNAGATSSVADIFGHAFLLGSIAGVASLFLMGTIYARLGSRAGKSAARNQVFHVLAYGGVPLAASLIVWIFAALLTGEATFESAPHPDAEGFVALLLRIQFLTYVVLMLWSVVIQVMGLSEIQGVATRKAFGLWVLGQLIGFLALLFLMILIATLFPSAVTGG
ncbi:MAG: YIP1 family protein [Steroidobacteraceae bacterium]